HPWTASCRPARRARRRGPAAGCAPGRGRVRLRRLRWMSPGQCRKSRRAGTPARRAGGRGSWADGRWGGTTDGEGRPTGLDATQCTRGTLPVGTAPLVHILRPLGRAAMTTASAPASPPADAASRSARAHASLRPYALCLLGANAVLHLVIVLADNRITVLTTLPLVVIAIGYAVYLIVFGRSLGRVRYGRLV